MIVNVPFVFDEDALEKRMEETGYERCIAELMGDIRKSFLPKYSLRTSIGNEDLRDAMRDIVERRIDYFLTNEWKDEIIESAGKHLAERIVRSKRFKERIEEVIDENH